MNFIHNHTGYKKTNLAEKRKEMTGLRSAMEEALKKLNFGKNDFVRIKGKTVCNEVNIYRLLAIDEIKEGKYRDEIVSYIDDFLISKYSKEEIADKIISYYK